MRHVNFVCGGGDEVDKKTKGKNIRKVSWIVGVVIVFLAILCGWRIWNVNHTKLIEKYKATIKVYEIGTDIHLSDAIYH